MQTFRRIALSIALLTSGVFAVHPAFLWQLAGSVCLKGAYAFDGINDKIDVSDDATLDMTGDMTASVWFKSANTPTGNEALFTKYNAIDVAGWIVLVRATGKLRVDTRSSATYEIGTESTATVTDGTWHHAVFVRSGTSKLTYIDGVLEASDTILSGSWANTEALSIGYNASTSSLYFDGLISETRLYSEALTATEISDLYTYGRNPDDTNLEAWYEFDGDATDSTANGNDGTVSGAVITTDPADLPDCAPR